MLPSKIVCIITLPFLLYACSSNKKEGSTVDSSTSIAPEGATQKSIYESGYDGGYKMVKDEETGFMKPVSEKEGNPFGNKTNQFKGKNQEFNKAFSTSNYDTRRWSGADKKKSILPWKNSKKEFQYSPQFIKDNSNLAHRTPSEKGKEFSRSQFSTSSAREQTSDRIQKVPDYVVKKRRESFTQPPIISNQSYNESGRSVEDVKGLLGD